MAANHNISTRSKTLTVVNPPARFGDFVVDLHISSTQVNDIELDLDTADKSDSFILEDTLAENTLALDISACSEVQVDPVSSVAVVNKGENSLSDSDTENKNNSFILVDTLTDTSHEHDEDSNVDPILAPFSHKATDSDRHTVNDTTLLRLESSAFLNDTPKKHMQDTVDHTRGSCQTDKENSAAGVTPVDLRCSIHPVQSPHSLQQHPQPHRRPGQQLSVQITI